MWSESVDISTAYGPLFYPCEFSRKYAYSAIITKSGLFSAFFHAVSRPGGRRTGFGCKGFSLPEPTGHPESLLRNVVEAAAQDLLEAADGLFQRTYRRYGRSRNSLMFSCSTPLKPPPAVSSIETTILG